MRVVLACFALFGLACLLVACRFEPDLSAYPACGEDGACAPACVCLGGQVCVPEDRENRDMLPSFCDPANTCGADLLNDPENCGECGRVCQFENASAYCERGACLMGECDPGWGNCANPDDSGCPDSLDTRLFCGDCGTHCRNETPFCVERVCVAICEPPDLECDGECITDPETNNQHCGACGNDCTTLLHVDSAGCEDSACVIYDCADGFDNCDQNHDNGCETPLGTEGNCKGCNDSCNDINGTSVCTAQGCVATCDGNWRDCNGQGFDGCEAQLGTEENCLFCGDLCGVWQVCTEEGCHGLNCSYPYADCGTGECVNLLEHEDHCGTCDTRCGGNVLCLEGSCGGEGLHCGETSCLQGRCCVEGGIASCSFGACEDLVDAELSCDSAADCLSDQACCMLQGAWHPESVCSVNCAGEEILCATDEECLSAPGGPFLACCPSVTAPNAYSLCSNAPCSGK